MRSEIRKDSAGEQQGMVSSFALGEGLVGGCPTALVVFQGIVHRTSLVVLGDIVLSVEIYVVLAFQMLIFDAFGLQI